MRTSVPHVIEDAFDDLLQIQVVGVDDHRVVRRTQWRDRTLGIDAIPKLDLPAHRLLVDALATPLVLSRAAPHLLVEARHEEELVVGVGKHDGADVASGHDNAIPGHLPLLLDQRPADTRGRRHHRQRVGVVRVVDALGELVAVGPHTLAVDADLRRLGQPRDRVAVVRVDPAHRGEACDGPVHQAAVDEWKAQALGDAPAHGRFPRGDAPVDRHYHRGSSPVARRSAATSPLDSTRNPPVLRRPRRRGPNAVRRSASVLWPIACSMRRTWRCLPSRITTRSSARPESRSPVVARTISTSAGAVTPSSSCTPRRSASRLARVGTPAVTTSYSLDTL